LRVEDQRVMQRTDYVAGEKRAMNGMQEIALPLGSPIVSRRTTDYRETFVYQKLLLANGG